MCATDPPLVLTHIPLLKVPAGAVNVHGYLHRAAGPTDRHVNVSVEHTDYAPVGLTYVQACGAGEVRHALVDMAGRQRDHAFRRRPVRSWSGARRRRAGKHADEQAVVLAVAGWVRLRGADPDPQLASTN